MRRIARLAYIVVFPLGCFAEPAIAQAPIDFRPLDATRGVQDCVDADTAAVAPTVCRVRRPFALPELRARLEAGDPVREGDELTWVAEIDADSVELSGGVQVPMARVRGTDLWVVTVRIAGLDLASIAWFFFPFRDGQPLLTRVSARHFRGPLAPAAPDTATAMRGRFVTDSIDSRFLPAPRGVAAYIPPARGEEPIVAVVYIGDGAARPMAAIVDTLIAAGRLPRIMLVGMETDMTRQTDANGLDGRTLEYLFVPGNDNARFLAHERFFLEEVVPWAEALGAPAERHRRAVAGFSNSAAFAIDMGLRHPELFGRVLAFSPAGRRAQILPETELHAPAEFYLLGGVLEKGFHEKAVAWADIFRSRGIRYALREPVAGHDWYMWQAMFRDAVAWAFGG